MGAAADYFPDPDIDPYEFERFYHRAWTYQPDAPPPKEQALPNDYVPNYSWFEAATKQLRARLTFRPTLRPVLPFVPLLVPEPSPVSGETKEPKGLVRWTIEANFCLLAGIEENEGAFTLEDVDPYLVIVEGTLRQIRNSLGQKKATPRPRRMGGLIPLFGKERFWDGDND